MRRNLSELVKKLVLIREIEDIGLTTNGLLLRTQAQALYDAGLKRINISLDALDPTLFARMNGRGTNPGIILNNIDYVKSMGFAVKVNMVVQRNVNESQILPMAAYFKERGITLRFIEFMDVGNENDWSLEKVITQKEIYERLIEVFELVPLDRQYFGEVAKRYRYKNCNAEVGFITSVSESFCSSCTRARLSSEGKFYTCLFASEGIDLRQLLRGGATDEEILSEIRHVWENRSDRYSDERTNELNKNKRKKISMSYIGG